MREGVRALAQEVPSLPLPCREKLALGVSALSLSHGVGGMGKGL